jgi:2-methylcitrate dehydratase PrpD
MTAEPDTVVHRLARLAAAGPGGDRADAVIGQVRRCVRDVLGVGLAAVHSAPARSVGAVVDDRGGSEQAGLIGRRGRVPAAAAALWGGTLAHALDYDDTHLPSVLHPSASVVPAALASGEAAGADGPTLVRAVAAGDEIAIRLGMAGYDPQLRNSIFFERGLHATAICGTIGAAAAAAVVMGLDDAGAADALGIAASMGAGLLEANRTGGTVKRVHCGWAAHAGVTAAELARAGLTGPPTAIEGRFGFLQAYCGEHARLDALLGGLGTDWELLRMFFKPYPTNHFTHAGIDAALALRADGLRPDDVADVELAVSAPALRTIGEPAEEKAHPATGYAAKFSGPFTFAAGLSGGGGLGVGLEDFPDGALDGDARIALAGRVRCVADPECDAIFPDEFPAIVRVRTADGGRREVKVLHNRGGPNNPLSEAELDRKFRDNASRALPEARVDALAAAIDELERLPHVGELTALMRPETS